MVLMCAHSILCPFRDAQRFRFPYYASLPHSLIHSPCYLSVCVCRVLYALFGIWINTNSLYGISMVSPKCLSE